MNIIYLTSAIEEKDFESYLTHWKTSPNPSNQNFHNKLIRALSLTNKIHVVSARPFSRKLCDLEYLEKEEKTIDNIIYSYLRINRRLASRLVSEYSQIKKIIKRYSPSDTVIFVDTINPALVYFANKIAKKKKMKVIGIVTDSPSNITGTGKSFTKLLLSTASNFNGYLALTEQLNDLYNKNSAPFEIINGVVEKNTTKVKKPEREYIFFGGALLERYGVYDLIKAFKKLKRKDIDLIICGHHENKDRLNEEIKDCTNIKFLGCLPLNKVLTFEKNALININPRPFSEDLDRFSIPSKTLEYLTSGRITISGRNTILKEMFENDIIWIKKNDSDSIYQAIKEALDLNSENRQEIAKNAEKKALEIYGFDAVSNKINNLIKKVL